MNEIFNEKQVKSVGGSVQSDCALISSLLADKLPLAVEATLELMCGSRLCARVGRGSGRTELRRENRLPTAHRPQKPKKAKWHNFTFVQGG